MIPTRLFSGPYPVPKSRSPSIYPNELLFAAAKRQAFANLWVEKNVAAYYPSTQIEAIAVGNEVFVDPHNTTTFLIPAMKNVHKALVKYNLHSAIKVSSPIALGALQNSYPSSAGSFKSRIDYALFRENPGVVDPGNGLRYFNLFDAQIDAVFAAMSALKYEDIKLVVSETGWPSKGDESETGASVDNCRCLQRQSCP
ncbi:Glucan endo-1,3-beta-glucosidase 3 [Quillaja saponaria]|uniref:glucan endo-1,3-beta-D-glucosidase n=1 Tax=Quillaja saponaria TaxID=32244 RepID=A0AAD7LLF8_QUISA|nr:Glucan endo-1,3-beta-glucosidase 3 [Quillaja saponaria]